MESALDKKVDALYLKKFRRNVALTLLIKLTPRIVHSTASLLKTFCATVNKIRVELSPREFYATEQCHLTSLQIIQEITELTLDIRSLNDDIENLFALHDQLSTAAPHVCKSFRKHLQGLTVAIGELQPWLAQLSTEREMDWRAVLERYAVTKPAIENINTNLMSMVPKIDQFCILRLLGAGGFGAAYKASLGNIQMVLKFIPVSKMDVPRCACVDKLVASVCRSPFLITYHSCFAIHEAYVTCMEYIRGVDLHKILKLGNSFPPDVIQLVAAQMGLAIKYLHFKGLIHRDIKPSNALMTPNCKLKVIDFDTIKPCIGQFVATRSYAKRTQREITDKESTGTLPFYSPEIVRKEPYGRSLDWWAFGVTIFQLANGKLPFRDYKVDRQIKDKICRGHYVWNPQAPISDELKSFIKNLLQTNAKRRLCSRSYSDFEKQPLFADMNWRLLELGRISRPFEAVKNCMVESTDYAGQLSPVISRDAQKKKAKLFNDVESWTDTQTHYPLYTFATRGFIACLEKLKADIDIDEGDIYEAPELLYQMSVNDAYIEKDIIHMSIPKGADKSLCGFNYVFEKTPSNNSLRVVQRVESGSAAQHAGLVAGDIIIRWTNRRIKEVGTFVYLAVCPQSPIRLLMGDKLEHKMLSMMPISVTLRRDDELLKDFFILATARKANFGVLFILRTCSQLRATPQIYAGDVITEVNSTKVWGSSLNENYATLFEPTNGIVKLKVVPLSGLRFHSSSECMWGDELESQILKKMVYMDTSKSPTESRE